MNKKLKNTGITLISLVITIIVMLILVGVSITLAVNGGLFEYAGNAVGDTKNAMKNEQGLIDEIINDYIKPNVPEIPEGLKVGDYVNYTPTTGTYRVANGATARSINVEDINSKTTYRYEEYIIPEYGYKYNDIKQLSEYGTGHNWYPNLYGYEVGYGEGTETEVIFNQTGLNESEGLEDGVTNEKSKVTTYSKETGKTEGIDPYVTFTYYKYNPDQWLNSNIGINSAPKGLIEINANYWLASRCVRIADKAYYCLRTIHYENGVGATAKMSGFGRDWCDGYCVRTIVQLDARVSLKASETQTSEDFTYWDIEY